MNFATKFTAGKKRSCLLNFQVPYLLDKPGVGFNVEGEIYLIDQEMLEVLDELEDAPRYYKRKIEKVKLIGDFSHEFQGGEVLPCYCYQLDNFKDEMLAKPFVRVYSSKEYPYTES